jgi:hypothetical protein
MIYFSNKQTVLRAACGVRRRGSRRVVMLASCADPGSTAPRSAADDVRLSLAVEVSAAARALAVDVGYRNAAGRVSLLHRELPVDGTRQVPLAINIAPVSPTPSRDGE